MDAKVAKKIEEKEEITEPWSPANILTIDQSLKDKLEEMGLRPRWKRKDELDKARLEGWEPLNVKDPDIASKVRTLIDGSSLGTTIEKRNLILCVMPLKRVAARAKFFEKMTDDSLHGNIDKFKQETNVPGHGARAYGSVDVKIGSKEGG